MDEFSYLSVLLSVILGLAVTQILKGFRGLVLARAQIRIYWPVLAWAFLWLLACVQSWWAMFGMRGIQNWTFEQFSVVLLQTVLTYMVAGLIFPDLFGTEPIDLKASFYAHRKWFFLLALSVIVTSVVKDVVLAGHLPTLTNLTFHAVFGATLLTGAITPNERYHQLIPLFGIALFVLYIFVLFARIH
ncbi:MAG TPA: hypothetical protein VLK27_02555 [Chthoniobacterales bacterium]|nr:hypothetical protein [Chthoniobacterales bacterium]